jgi:uncharacterized OsmC-like protein
MMTTSTVTYLGNLHTELKHSKSGEIVLTDAPTDNNGKGEFFSPTDLCATSLASCAITTMGIKANAAGINLGRIDADVYKVMASNPRRISEVRISMTIVGSYSEDEKRMLELTGINCPVAKSLHPDVVQHINFKWK